MFKLILKKKRGFTLLEALVAISILMVAVVAPITIAQKGLSSAVYSKNQMTASYLAQDALEYVINKKDQKAIENIGSARDSYDWLGSFIGCLDSDECAIDTVFNSGEGKIEVDGEYTFLKKDTNGFYGYGGSSGETNFKRWVNVSETEDDVSALVTVIVSWSEDNDDKIEVKSLIYNY